MDLRQGAKNGKKRNATQEGNSKTIQGIKPLAGRDALEKQEKNYFFSKILSIFCLSVSAVNGLTM